MPVDHIQVVILPKAKMAIQYAGVNNFLSVCCSAGDSWTREDDSGSPEALLRGGEPGHEGQGRETGVRYTRTGKIHPHSLARSLIEPIGTVGSCS